MAEHTKKASRKHAINFLADIPRRFTRVVNLVTRTKKISSGTKETNPLRVPLVELARVSKKISVDFIFFVIV